MDKGPLAKMHTLFITALLAVGLSFVNFTDPANRNASPSTLLHDEDATFEQVASDSSVDSSAVKRAKLRTLLNKLPRVKLSRKNRTSSPKLTLSDLQGEIKVTSIYKSSKNTRSILGRTQQLTKYLESGSSWTFKLGKLINRIILTAPGIKSWAATIPGERFSREVRLVTKDSKLKNDYARFGEPTTFWDTCGYEFAPGTNSVSRISESNVIYYGGDVSGRYQQDIEYALEQASQATGFEFRRSTKPVVINYLGFTVTENLAAAGSDGWSISGKAGPGWTQVRSGGSRYVGADISLNLDQSAPANAVRRLIMHEVGHALGLEHAQHKSQVMYPVVQNSVAQWGMGDLSGLNEVANKGCHFKVGQEI